MDPACYHGSGVGRGVAALAVSGIKKAFPKRPTMVSLSFLEDTMPYVYRDFRKILGLNKVDGGECARLVQHFMSKVGRTSTWRPAERVVDILKPVIATRRFTKARCIRPTGLWPVSSSSTNATRMPRRGIRVQRRGT